MSKQKSPIGRNVRNQVDSDDDDDNDDDDNNDGNNDDDNDDDDTDVNAVNGDKKKSIF